ncbi:tetratricopeptide repeat protein [Psychrobacter sp. I-STPA10]|uniref:tetratricopeptide repeat protein n=1 Tax=Psychrobacter sp. I-STPA10 TaxID=2585769 RepID=UPI001E3ACB61|nr:tetratricopeptide repeat protein [Psychrobacter sp. I-STPA10]
MPSLMFIRPKPLLLSLSLLLTSMTAFADTTADNINNQLCIDNPSYKNCYPAAEQGDAKAQNNLGVMYHQGLGVEQSYTEAAKWYQKAALQGNIDAQFNLGMMYENGLGVPQSYTEAIKWYQKSGTQGHEQAQQALQRLER